MPPTTAAPNKQKKILNSADFISIADIMKEKKSRLFLKSGLEFVVLDTNTSYDQDNLDDVLDNIGIQRKKDWKNTMSKNISELD